LPAHPNPASYFTETLACPLTPPAEGGINIIALSGPAAPRILDGMFHSQRGRRASEMKPGHLLYGTLHRGESVLDEVVLECAQGPPVHEYRINCHGGYLAARRILDALQASGVRAGSWGEILSRKQAVGEIDAVRREAAELIQRCPTMLAAQVILDQYHGALSQAVPEASASLTNGRDPDPAAESLRCLLRTARFGRGLFEYARLVLTGRPNVGKSTLVNALLRFERVIVHHATGTTRDAIEEVVSIKGLPFTLVDTAGIRPARNPIEQEGMRRGMEEMHSADVVLLLFDGSEPLRREDERILKRPPPERTIPVVNKCDLPLSLSVEDLARRMRARPLVISAAVGTGLEVLETRILETAYGGLPEPGRPVIFTARQEDRIRTALAALERGDAAGAAAALRSLIGERS